MKRAVVIYLEDKLNLMIQFSCLYTSIKHIRSKDTDLVVFGTREALRKVPEDCIKIESQPISYSHEWKNYHFINSISCLTDDKATFLDEYDLILRTDADTFITPSWNNYYPEHFTVGGGGYAHDISVKDRLIKVADSLGLKHQGIHNIGSTHYGNASLVRDVCKLSVSTAKHLLHHEFKEGPGQFPLWYIGVVSMYSGEVAVNHLVDKVVIDDKKLDYYSDSSDNISDHPHIHSWHTNEIFSKFRFYDGKYNHYPTSNLDQNIIKYYCLYTALKARHEMPWCYRR